MTKFCLIILVISSSLNLTAFSMNSSRTCNKNLQNKYVNYRTALKIDACLLYLFYISRHEVANVFSLFPRQMSNVYAIAISTARQTLFEVAEHAKLRTFFFKKKRNSVLHATLRDEKYDSN